MLDVYYSYDRNVLRGVDTETGRVWCHALSLGGRRLKSSELKAVASNVWKAEVRRFIYIKKGRG